VDARNGYVLYRTEVDCAGWCSQRSIYPWALIRGITRGF